MTDEKNVAGRAVDGGPDEPADPTGRRTKFGAAADGWEAYNTWLERVRQQSGRTSRQAVIAKSLYSVSSYKSWADKAKGAFDKAK